MFSLSFYHPVQLLSKSSVNRRKRWFNVPEIPIDQLWNSLPQIEVKVIFVAIICWLVCGTTILTVVLCIRKRRGISQGWTIIRFLRNDRGKILFFSFVIFYVQCFIKAFLLSVWCLGKLWYRVRHASENFNIECVVPVKFWCRVFHDACDSFDVEFVIPMTVLMSSSRFLWQLWWMYDSYENSDVELITPMTALMSSAWSLWQLWCQVHEAYESC